MGFTPLLDPFHVLGVAEVISVAWFAQPAPLTGGFAGLATSRSQTEKLTTGIMNVRSKTCLAAAAFASVMLGTHRLPSRKKTGPSNQSKNSPGRREKTKKEEKFRAEARRKSERRTNIFRPAVFPHYHSAADTCAAAPPSSGCQAWETRSITAPKSRGTDVALAVPSRDVSGWGHCGFRLRQNSIP